MNTTAPQNAPQSRLIGRAAGFVALLALAVNIAASWVLVRPGWRTGEEKSYLLGGDEPAYLMAARSLALDGDFNVYNDFRDHGLRDLCDRDVMELGYERFRALAAGRAATHEYWKERRYLAVRPGLPALIAPAYRIGLAWDGRVRLAVVWQLCLWGACLAGLLVWAAARILPRISIATAVGAVLATVLAAPLLFYATQVYTELAAALLITAAFALRFGIHPVRTGPAWAAGLAIAALPWLHDKYLPHALMLFAAWSTTFRRAPRGVWLGLALPAVVSLAGQAAFYHMLYGVPWPRSDHGALSLLTGWRSGWAGLLVDRTDGLWIWWPVAPFAIAGLLTGSREVPALRWAGAMVLAHGIMTGVFPVWTGGPVAPLRYWVPVMPMLALGLAAWGSAPQPKFLRGVTMAAALAGVAVAAWTQWHPRNLFRDLFPWDGISGGFLAPLARFLPDAKNEAGLSNATVLVLFAILAAVLFVLCRLARKRPAIQTLDGK